MTENAEKDKISILKWPSLSHQELAFYYNEIKANKVDISFTCQTPNITPIKLKHRF